MPLLSSPLKSVALILKYYDTLKSSERVVQVSTDAFELRVMSTLWTLSDSDGRVE